jgi:hypothetical protein
MGWIMKLLWLGQRRSWHVSPVLPKRSPGCSDKPQILFSTSCIRAEFRNIPWTQINSVIATAKRSAKIHGQIQTGFLRRWKFEPWHSEKALRMHKLGARCGRVANTKPLPLYPRDRNPLRMVQEAGWVAGRIPNCPVPSESLYRLSYRGPTKWIIYITCLTSV